jgi:hypothetical protein
MLLRSFARSQMAVNISALGTVYHPIFEFDNL